MFYVLRTDKYRKKHGKKTAMSSVPSDITVRVERRNIESGRPR